MLVRRRDDDDDDACVKAKGVRRRAQIYIKENQSVLLALTF